MSQITLTVDRQQTPSVKIDIFYGMISLGGTAIWSFLSGWLLYFYLPPEGRGTPLVPVALYGAAVLGVRIIHAFLTQFIGYWSDHMRSRWGRRLPLMFVSGLPILACFVLLWMPPVKAESIGNLVYFVAILGLYNIAYSLYQIPYNALLPELALTDHHRVRMSTWYAGFQLMGMILAGFAGIAVEKVGYASTALLYAGIALPLLYLPFLVLRERPGRQIATEKRLDFWRSIAATFTNRPFWIFVIALGFYWVAGTFVQAAIPFIATEVCLLTEADTIYFYIPAVLASLVCFPIITKLSQRVGKWRVFAGSLLASAVMLPALALIGDWVPLPLLTQGIVWVILEAIAMSGLAALPSAFMAEITDYDEGLTGQRREGSYYAAWGLLDQVVNGLASASLPLLFLLGRSRSDPHGPLGVRMVGVVGGVLLFVAFLVFLRYPLRRQDQDESA